MKTPAHQDGSELIIRPSRISDTAIITQYNVALALETEDKRLDTAVVQRGVELLMQRPNLGHYYVAEADGLLVGQLMITFEWSDWRSGVFWWIQSVYVHPEHRKRGVFTRLYQHVEQQARAAGEVCGIRLYVDHRNGRAMRSYEKLGMCGSGHMVYETDWSEKAR